MYFNPWKSMWKILDEKWICFSALNALPTCYFGLYTLYFLNIIYYTLMPQKSSLFLNLFFLFLFFFSHSHHLRGTPFFFSHLRFHFFFFFPLFLCFLLHWRGSWSLGIWVLSIKLPFYFFSNLINLISKIMLSFGLIFRNFGKP